MIMEDSPISVAVPPMTTEVGAAAATATAGGGSSDKPSAAAAATDTAPAVDSATPPSVPEEKLDGKELLEALKKQVSDER